LINLRNVSAVVAAILFACVLTSQPTLGAESYPPIFTIASVSQKPAPVSAFLRSRSCSSRSQTLAAGLKSFVQTVIDKAEHGSVAGSFPATLPQNQDARGEWLAIYHRVSHGFVIELQILKSNDAVNQTLDSMIACTSLGTGARSQIVSLGLYADPKTHAGIFYSSDAGFYIVQPDPGDDH
jgi:hypothetical protein